MSEPAGIEKPDYETLHAQYVIACRAHDHDEVKRLYWAMLPVMRAERDRLRGAL